MGLWGTTLHKDTIFFFQNLFLGQKESKNTKKVNFEKKLQPASLSKAMGDYSRIYIFSIGREKPMAEFLQTIVKI